MSDSALVPRSFASRFVRKVILESNASAFERSLPSLATMNRRTPQKKLFRSPACHSVKPKVCEAVPFWAASAEFLARSGMRSKKSCFQDNKLNGRGRFDIRYIFICIYASRFSLEFIILTQRLVLSVQEPDKSCGSLENDENRMFCDAVYLRINKALQNTRSLPKRLKSKQDFQMKSYFISKSFFCAVNCWPTLIV